MHILHYMQLINKKFLNVINCMENYKASATFKVGLAIY